MTAINIVLQREAAHIITDGAAYKADGTLVAAASKVLPLPQLSAAVAVRGPSLALACFGADIGMRFQSFDEIVAGLPLFGHWMVDRYSPLWSDHYEVSAVEIYIVGWSEGANAFEAYVMRTEDFDADRLSEFGLGTAADNVVLPEAFEMMKLEDVSVAPGFDVLGLKELGFRPAGAEGFDPETDGRRVLEMQRQINLPILPGMPSSHHVGCFAQRTTVRRDRIDQVIFHRWNDQIGERITPDPIDVRSLVALRPSVANVESLSRMQRERMEKKARKGTLRAI